MIYSILADIYNNICLYLSIYIYIILNIILIYIIYSFWRNPELLSYDSCDDSAGGRRCDDREDRRGAVQTGGDGAVESASRSGRQPSRLPNEEPG